MSQSLDRALTIIVACAERPRSLAELAMALDVHRSTVLRLLQTMESRGFMRRTADGVWQVGPTLMGISAGALDALELRTAARPWLSKLVSEFGNAVHLVEPSGGSLVYIDKAEGRGAVKMLSRVGSPVVLHTAGAAKAFLAFCEPGRRDELLTGHRFERFTATTITSRAAFDDHLGGVGRQAWAEDDGELEDYLNCVAVPVLDQSGYACGALSMTALRALEPLEELRLRVPRLLEAARAVSLDMGWKGEDT